MRHSLVLGVMALTLIVPLARAEVRFSTTQIDAGEVKSGVPLVRRFEIVNAGSSAVEITEVRVGCGCVKPKFDPPAERMPCPLTPGEKRTVLLEINTLSQAEGEQSWHATVAWTENGQAYEQKLVLLGKVVTEVSVQPASLFIFTDTALRHDVTLIDRRAKPLTVTAVQVASPHLKAQLRPAAQEGQVYRAFRIELEVRADCPEGRYDDTLSILTNDPVYAEVKVPVTLVRRGRQRVKTAPESVWLQAADGGPVPAKLLRVYDAGDRAVVVERVTVEDPAVTATWAQGQDGTATIKVQVDREKVTGTRLMTTALQIQLKEPERETLTLPVTVVLE